MSEGTDAPAAGRPRPIDALLLGLLHGPAELVPVSSSGHATLVPWLLGLPYSSLPAAHRKTIEVALHAGTAAALLVSPPRSTIAMPRGLRAIGLAAATLAPTALAGLLAGRTVRERLGTPATVAGGLATGSIALLLGDLAHGSRTARSARWRDGLTVGAAQAAALWPGVSRSAMSIVAFRALGFAAGDAARLSRSGIVPAATAATVLEGLEAHRDGRLADDAAAIATAAGASFASTLAARPLARRLERGGRLWPWAALRIATASAAVLRIRALGDDGRR